MHSLLSHYLQLHMSKTPSSALIELLAGLIGREMFCALDMGLNVRKRAGEVFHDKEVNGK